MNIKDMFNKKNMDKIKIKSESAISSQIPKLRVEILDNNQAIIEGSKSILEYNDNCIRLSSGKLIIKFQGKLLTMKAMNSSSAIIEGKIISIEYI